MVSFLYLVQVLSLATVVVDAANEEVAVIMELALMVSPLVLLEHVSVHFRHLATSLVVLALHLALAMPLALLALFFLPCSLRSLLFVHFALKFFALILCNDEIVFDFKFN